MFRKVVEDMVSNKEVNITSRYESLQRNNIAGDFEFVVMDKRKHKKNTKKHNKNKKTTKCRI